MSALASPVAAESAEPQTEDPRRRLEVEAGAPEAEHAPGLEPRRPEESTRAPRQSSVEVVGAIARDVGGTLDTDPDDIFGRVRRRMRRLDAPTRRAVAGRVQEGMTPERQSAFRRLAGEEDVDGRRPPVTGPAAAGTPATEPAAGSTPATEPEPVHALPTGPEPVSAPPTASQPRAARIPQPEPAAAAPVGTVARARAPEAPPGTLGARAAATMSPGAVAQEAAAAAPSAPEPAAAGPAAATETPRVDASAIAEGPVNLEAVPLDSTGAGAGGATAGPTAEGGPAAEEAQGAEAEAPGAPAAAESEAGSGAPATTAAAAEAVAAAGSGSSPTGAGPESAAGEAADAGATPEAEEAGGGADGGGTDGGGGEPAAETPESGVEVEHEPAQTPGSAAGEVAGAAGLNGGASAPEAGGAAEEAGDGAASLPAAGGGGGGTPIPDRPPPQQPDVSAMEPEQALATATALPPAQMQETLQGADAAADRTVAAQEAQLAANPPQLQRPSGAPGEGPVTLGGEVPAPSIPGPTTPSPGAPAAARRVRRAAPRPSLPPLRPSPLPPPPAPPPMPAPVVSDGPQGELTAADAEAMQSAVRDLPTHDPALAITAGPPPQVALAGEASPEHTAEQRAHLEESVAATAAHGADEAAQPLGEDEIYPRVPAETLRPTPGGGGPTAPGAAAAASPAGAGQATTAASQATPAGQTAATTQASTAAASGAPAPAEASASGGALDEAASIVAQEQKGPEIRAAAAQAQGEMATRRREQADAAQQERARSQEAIQATVTDNAAQQERRRTEAQEQVRRHRRDWSEGQRQLVDQSRRDANAAQRQSTSDIERERSRGDSESRNEIDRGNRDAAAARRSAEAQAARERAQAQEESSGVLGWLASRARRFFRAIKERIVGIFDRARSLVRSVIDGAKRLATAAIDRARSAIVGAIKWAGDRLVEIGDRLLAGFPGLRDRFRRAIHSVVNAATAAVNALADELKRGVIAALNALNSALQWALNQLRRGLLAALNAVKGVVMGAIRFARAAIEAIAAFAGLIRDIAANPQQWLRNLAASAVDGVKNHLWGAFRRAIRQWFNQKLEQVLGLGMTIWRILTQGGIKLSEIGHMVWEGLKQSIPGILIGIVIEKLVSMIIPAAGAIMAIVEGLRAAWGTVSRVLQAFQRFIAFLRAVKRGNAGPQFAEMVASAAIVVIDFVSNWLLAKLKGRSGGIASRLKELAKRIGRKLMQVIKRVGAAFKRLGRAIKRGFRKLAIKAKRVWRRLFGKRKSPAERQAKARERTKAILDKALAIGVPGPLLRPLLFGLKTFYGWRTLELKRDREEGTFAIEGGFSPGERLVEGGERWKVIDLGGLRPSSDPKWRDVENVGWKYEAAVLQTVGPELRRSAGELAFQQRLSKRGERALGFRRPEATVVGEGEVTLVEATLAVTWVAVRTDKFGTHKAEQVPYTVFLARQRYPNAHIVYRVFAPQEPPEATRRLIEQLVQTDPNIEVVWGVLGSGSKVPA